MEKTAQQDYLQEIYRLQQEKNMPAEVSDLSARLSVSRPSVTEMVRRLSRDGYVTHRRYGGITLTAKGLAQASKFIRRHRIIETFLRNILGLDDVHEDAHNLEHAMSDTVIDRLAKAAKMPKTCPHGSPIPAKNARITTLDKVAPGTDMRIIMSDISDENTCKRLTSLGLVPNSIVAVKKKLRGGPMMIEVGGSEIAIGLDIVRHIYAEAA